MKIKNYTDISRERIAEIIRFVRPSGIANFDVRVSNCGGNKGRGMSYGHGSAYHSTAAPFVVVRIPTAKKFKPYVTWARKGYMAIPIGSREEELVHLLAHELRHQWQAKVKRGYRVWGARGQYSERDADAYALHKLREWRRA